MKYDQRKRVRNAVIALFASLSVLALIASASADMLPPMAGTFTGGSTTITNTGAPMTLSAAFVEGTVSNFAVRVVNVSGYTNTLSESYTNTLTYTPSLPFPVWMGGVIHLETTSTNQAKYVLYLNRK